jgi:hypothetical protein
MRNINLSHEDLASEKNKSIFDKVFGNILIDN